MSRLALKAPVLGLLLHRLGLERAARMSPNAKPLCGHEQLAHELELARAVEETLLPKPLTTPAGLALAAFSRSAQDVGGDFFDALPLRQDRCLLLLADIMGKGAPAALFVPLLRTTFHDVAKHMQRPGELLGRMNQLMFEELSRADMFITALLVLADPRQSSLTVASAGHCPLLLADKSGEVRSIPPDGMPLGIELESNFTQETIAFPPSTAALLYTDGLTEARNGQNAFFGQERLARCLCRGLARQMNAARLQQHLLAEIDQFIGGAPPHDDQTFLVLTHERPPACPLPDSGVEEPVGSPQAPRTVGCPKGAEPLAIFDSAAR